MEERDEELQKLIDANMELRPVGKKMVEISRDEELNGIYDREEHERRVRNSLIEDALEDGWNRGKKEGIEAGKIEGKAQGKKEGIKEVAKNLLKQGIDENILSESTGLSKEEIDELKSS